MGDQNGKPSMSISSPTGVQSQGSPLAQRPDELNKVLQTLLDYERVYNDNLRLALQRFSGPLEVSGLLDASDMKTIFGNLEEIYRKSLKMIDQLRLCMKSSSRLGSLPRLFTQDLLDSYKKYAGGHEAGDKHLSRVSQNDRVGAFLNVQQRVCHASLEFLLRQPVDRVVLYVHSLQKIAGLARQQSSSTTPAIQGLIAKWGGLSSAINAASNKRKSEDKTAAILLSFPRGQLEFLTISEEEEEGPSDLRQRRMSAPSLLMKKKVTADKNTKRSSLYELTDAIRSPVKRTFIMEGPVETRVMTEGAEEKRRFLFLFSDVLLIAKARGRGEGLYSLKTHVRLQDAWVNPMPMLGREDAERMILVGAPHLRNVVIVAPDAMQKGVWVTRLTEAVASCKASVKIPPATLKVLINIPSKMPRLDGPMPFVSISLSSTSTAHEAVAAILTKLDMPSSYDTDYNLWEFSSRGVTLLQPWECPACINAVANAVGIGDAECQLVLRHRASPPLTVETLPDKLSLKLKGSPRNRRRLQSLSQDRIGRDKPSPSGEADSAKRSNMAKRLGGASGLLRKVKDKVVSRSSRPGSPGVAPPPTPASKGLLFKRPISMTMVNQRLPEAVRDMLLRLYHDGPMTAGLFRKSANARVVRQLRERLDEGLPVDMDEIPVLVIGACLKEYLRSLPECLFPLMLYDEFVATNSIGSVPDRVASVQRAMEKLPDSHRTMLHALMPVLRRIAAHEEHNNMTAMNISICIGPSMMWPAKAEDVLKNDVPPFIEFVIQEADSIFGESLNTGMFHESPRRERVLSGTSLMSNESEDLLSPPLSPTGTDPGDGPLGDTHAEPEASSPSRDRSSC